MNLTKFFFILFSFVLIFSLFPSVNALIDMEYEEEMWSPINPTSLDCLFKVRLLIETEPDGNWTTDSSYKLHFFLTVTYINETHFEGDPLNFTGSVDNGTEYLNASKNVDYYLDDYISNLLVYSPITEKKMASYQFFPQNPGRIKIYPKLTIKDIEIHESYLYSDSWGNQHGYAPVDPITIDIKSISTTSSTELILLAFLTIIGIILIGASLMVKSRVLDKKYSPKLTIRGYFGHSTFYLLTFQHNLHP